MNADSGTKCCKMRKGKKGARKREKSDAKYLAIHFLFFAFRDSFRIFRDKCIAGLRDMSWVKLLHECKVARMTVAGKKWSERLPGQRGHLAITK